jgi:hypothetical protein
MAAKRSTSMMLRKGCVTSYEAAPRAGFEMDTDTGWEAEKK